MVLSWSGVRLFNCRWQPRNTYRARKKLPRRQSSTAALKLKMRERYDPLSFI